MFDESKPLAVNIRSKFKTVADEWIFTVPGAGSTSGRITARGRVSGKVRVVGKPFHLAAVMTTKPLLIPR